jgi:hypothetical protein
MYREEPFTDDGVLEWLYTTFKGFKNPCNWRCIEQYSKMTEKKDVPNRT